MCCFFSSFFFFFFFFFLFYLKLNVSFRFACENEKKCGNRTKEKR